MLVNDLRLSRVTSRLSTSSTDLYDKKMCGSHPLVWENASFGAVPMKRATVRLKRQ